ncbi:dual specificity mitogen-activated protein kinase kinase 5-like [Saccoglossus kowalevskii]|uniref:mitogen-activated protein kinase kinase n=1 Tax=Saccoglossus kowalevskii TaxID=10224 RepID=A0ABM0LXP5_SACKO|nr:PREDICTED: dual specificity mitogen-activated protein kinase kinase 5-like [Saccoglossus kowalevskii]
MSVQPFVIRIKNDQGEDVDWTVQTIQLKFNEVMEVMSQVFPDTTVTAFDYEDEDGDRITVRSDEEMIAMLSCYFDLTADCEESDMPPPLNIYPKVSKPPIKKNIHGLKVNTRVAQSSPPQPVVPAVVPAVPAVTKHEPDIRDILANGQVRICLSFQLSNFSSHFLFISLEALHLPSKEVMAIKVIPLDITPEIQKQIMSELQILYKCNFPVIIGFYGAFFSENRISICTQYMDGCSLDIYGCIPEPVLGRIAVAIVKGLNYLWSLKIMHRDVKPSNILVSTRGEVKLCDFGVSTQLVNSITKTYVGTNAYMAPERVLGDEYGVPSDVWSLGVFLLEMAQGRFPYPTTPKEQALSAIDLLQCIVHENPPRLPPGIFTAAFADFVEQCMQKTPSNRPKPEALMMHPFIQMYDDSNSQIIAEWVCSMQQEIKKQKLIQSQSAMS